jgi:DNA polymerase delta subunit 1
MIEKTRDLVIEKFSKKNGYSFDTDVIYGDTDSVMIKFGVETIEEAMKLGK